MDRLAPEVTRLEVSGQIALWHTRTGRNVTLSPEVLAEVERWTPGLPPPPDLRALAARLDAAHLLRESTQPDLTALIPARSRLVLSLPAEPALWLPLPATRTPGGHAYAERRLSALELALWRGCNGARAVRDVARAAGCTPAVALAFFAELTHPTVQALQLRDRPVSRRDLSLERMVAPDRPPAPRPGHLRGEDGETTLAHYHLREITDGATHFDDRETTVAHAFAVPHPGLGGMPYGERLHEALDGLGLVPTDGGQVLEIGPGDGELAQHFLARAARVGRPLADYVRLDQSPALLDAQQRRVPRTRGLLGSATTLPFPDASLRLVLCNEVIADLTAAPYDPADRDRLAPGSPAAEVAARLERYGLAPLPGRALYNLGAWRLIEELARTLAPGGAAWVSEFGALDEIPQETEQLDHPEVSIHFGHLVSIARALGLEASALPLAEVLGFDLNTHWLSRHSYEALRARLRATGRTLAARAWTPETLTLPWPVEGLHWVSLADPGPGPLVTRFMGLVLRR